MFCSLLQLIQTYTPTGNTSSVISKYRHVIGLIKIRACRETLSWRHNIDVNVITNDFSQTQPSRLNAPSNTERPHEASSGFLRNCIALT